LLGDSLRPSGYQHESFAGRTAHELDAGRLAKLTGLASASLACVACDRQPAAPARAQLDAAIRERILMPLDMRRSTFDFARAARGNHASAHGCDEDGKLALINTQLNHSAIPLRPAGGLWSSAREMLRVSVVTIAPGVNFAFVVGQATDAKRT
jgi:hypothetical protein